MVATWLPFLLRNRHRKVPEVTARFRYQICGFWNKSIDSVQPFTWDVRIGKAVNGLFNILTAGGKRAVWQLVWRRYTLEFWDLLWFLSTCKSWSERLSWLPSFAHRSKENTRAILPTAIILFLMICLRSSCGAKDGETSVSSSPSSSSSLVHVLRTATSMSVTIRRQWFRCTKRKGALFSPTNGKLQVKTSMKLGNQYGWGVQLNCLMFIMLLSYFRTAALLL